MVKAVIFDVDGTLAETEETHRMAFNAVFKEFGLDWVWDFETYRSLLTITGGKERITHYGREYAGIEPAADLVLAMHNRKNKLYETAVMNGQIAPRPGVVDFVQCIRDNGIVIAIATTTSRANFHALLRGVFPKWTPQVFASIVCGEDVHHKKPDPEVYLRNLRILNIEASEAIAVEDSEVGLRSALRAGIRTIVTPSIYTTHQNFEGAAAVLPQLGADELQDLGNLHSKKTGSPEFQA